MAAPGRVAWVSSRGRALGVGHRSGAGRGLVPAGGPGPVQEHRDGGGHDRGGHGDEGDLPAGHAADDDGVHLGRWPAPVRRSPPGGGTGRANAAGAAAVAASRAPASAARMRGQAADGGMGGCGSW